MIDDVEKVIRAYLPEIIHLSLATSQDNIPWSSELHYVYDSDLNIYFRSLPSRRHSIEIRANPKVSGSIMKQHVVGEAPRGIYFVGEASELANVDNLHPAYIEYGKRFGTNESILEEAKKPDGHKFYKISVQTFYLFDGKESNPGKKYELAWNR